MERSVLGTSGIRVSRICLGSATFGVAPDATSAGAMVGAALDLGIDFFDTADVYGSTPTFDRPGLPPAGERESAEEILGRALVGHRDDVVLASKSGERRFDATAGLSRRYIAQQVEQSLRRLQTDRIDLYYAHFPDPSTPLEETLAAYDTLIQQGKIRSVALSNHAAWQVTQALWIADDRRLASAPVAAQVQYSLLHRKAERELTSACQKFGLSIVPFAPLHGGLLADLAVLERPVAGDERYGGSRFDDREVAVARALADLADDWGMQMQHLSLAWLLAQPTVASVIVGAETPEELQANASATDINLTAEQVAHLSALTADLAD
ncbi:aldo/keto reductase [Occultella aeris]|uniref:General stress protein 69 n=1 Tax=Occultella aeris TaxID=2761496 RepID=A0A7M4DJW6_9MICO|nr:aldo/keto reductase [Occultella aeris]VZO37352.1 General stress protein 69 [Occultella aeris]